MEEELGKIILEDKSSSNQVRQRLSRDSKAMRDFQRTFVQDEQIESIGNKLHEYSISLVPRNYPNE
jgi:hypothetical protein